MVLLPDCACCDVCSKEDSDPDAGTAYDVGIEGSAEVFSRCVGLPKNADIKITQRVVVATMADSTTAALVIYNDGNTFLGGDNTRFAYFGVATKFGNYIPGTSPAQYYDRAQAYLQGGFTTQECCFNLNNESNGVTIEAEWRRVADSWTLYSSKLNGVAASLSGATALALPASSGYVWHGITGSSAIALDNGGKTYTSYYMKIEYL